MSLLENLETRRLFAAFTPGVSIANPVPTEYQSFGQVVATKGTLAAVAESGGGAKVRLYDTSTGQTLGEFSDPTGAEYARFGASLAFVGEDKLAIGAPEADMGTGAVHIFDVNTAAFVTSYTGQQLTGFTQDPDAPLPAINFGVALADYHGNLLISVASDSTIGGAGRVFEIDPLSGAVLRQFDGPERSSYNFDRFGATLAVDGDNILFFAQRNAVEFGSGETVVYLFDGSNFYNDQNQLRAFTDPSGRGAERIFGSSLLVRGDDVLIAAPYGDFDSSTFVTSGSPVYHFSAATGSLVQTIDLPDTFVHPAPESSTHVGFGFGLALSGDTLAVGAPFTWNTTGSDYAGAVFAYKLSTGEFVASVANPADQGNFGTSIAVVGPDKFLITDPAATVGDAAWAGKVYVYSLTDDTPPDNELPPPTVYAGADQTVLTGDTVLFAGTAQAALGANLVSYEWDFSYDGTTFDADATGADASFVYTATGAYTVAFRVTDDHNHWTIDTLTVTVNAPPPPPAPPVTMVGNDLVVTGTDGADAVSFTTDDLGRVYVVLNTVSYGPFSPTGAIVVTGGDGDDVILGNKTIPVNLEIYGGAGNDIIAGGGANDILVAGTGDDQVTAGTGRDLIIGSEGADDMIGKPGQDIVIAGRTLHDADPVALRAILNEWTNGGTVERRADNIRNTAYATASRLNGNYFLIPGSTVFDDGAVDTLSGGGGKDWLMFNVTGTGVLDILTDGDKNDLITDL